MSLTFAFLAQDVSVDEALTMSLAVPTVLPEVYRSVGEWEVDNNSFIINVTHEGVLVEGTDDDGEFELSAEFSEEPIETHPGIDSLLKNYGGTKGDDGRVQFAETIAGTAAAKSTGLSGGKKGKTEINPMFGVSTFPAMRIVATHRRARKALGGSIWSTVGTVVNSLPSGFSEPGGKKWLVMPPLVRRRGNTWDVTRRWKDITLDRQMALLSSLIQR